MTGDGVNDALALKDADIGIAMGSGAPATRAVAQVVLLDGQFAAMPGVVAEGRRVIANVERVANLFVTKTVYAMLLAIAVGVARWPYPFLPRHLTIISSLTIGIPAFFLALGPSSRRYVPASCHGCCASRAGPGWSRRSRRSSVYAVAREVDGVSLDEARTAATIVLLVRRALDPRACWRGRSRRCASCCSRAMAGAFVGALAMPGVRALLRARAAARERGRRGRRSRSRSPASALECRTRDRRGDSRLSR